MKEPLPLREYQIADLAFLFSQDRAGLFSEPGVGKTPPACVYSFARWQDDQARVVWTQPQSLLDKNFDEFMRFTPFSDEDVAILRGTPQQRRKILQRRPKVLLSTADTFAKYADELSQDHQLFIGDEWHLMFKGHQSGRTTALDRFMRTRKWLVAMTGTMIHGRLDSIYPWVRLVNAKYYFNHDAFVNQHATFDPFVGKITGWDRNLAKVAEIFRRHSIRRTRLDVYGPDAIVRQVERVPMGRRQRERYQEYHERALIELEDGRLLESGSSYAMARAILEHPELIAEWATDPETGKRRRTGRFVDITNGERTSKDERLLVHLADHVNDGTPLVYFGALQLQLERVVRLLNEHGVTAALIHGGVPGKRRSEIDAAFRAGKLQAIVASPDTAGVGFNWQFSGGREVEHVIFGSLPPMDTSLGQAEARFCRETRQVPLRSTILEYERSIDQRIFALIERKSKEAAEVDKTREVYELKQRKEVA